MRQKYTRKIYGGSPESKFRMYAGKMRRKELFDTNKFGKFLDGVSNPLMRAYDFDNDGKKYTINEYALIHSIGLSNGFDIHAKFRKHKVDLSRTVLYPNFNITHHLNIFEAYIYNAEYLENIKLIMMQIETEKKYDLYFRAYEPVKGIPSVLYFALESSMFVDKPLDINIYHSVMGVYTHPTMYVHLTQNNPSNILNLLSLAIRYNKPGLMIEICKKMESSEMIYSYIFTKQVVTYLLLQNNMELFKAVFSLIESIQPEKVLKYISKYAIDPNKDASKILQKYMNNMSDSPAIECKRFFELLGLHILKDILPPYIGDTTRIIIRSHGSMLKEAIEQFDYPFNRLCYFVEKGTYLIDHCIVSNRVENMVCNGNYDDSLKCISSTNGMISTEPMLFTFDAGFYKGNKHGYTGIYICRNASVDKVDESIDKTYVFPDMIRLIKQICDKRNINYNYVDIMIFACRAKIGNTRTAEISRSVIPKITAAPEYA